MSASAVSSWRLKVHFLYQAIVEPMQGNLSDCIVNFYFFVIVLIARLSSVGAPQHKFAL
jgi:hypothetical protein